MERIIDRLDKYIALNKLNDNKVTTECGLSVGLIGQARKGKSDIGKKSADKILSKYQNINRVWFLTGEGEMLRTPEQGHISIASGAHSISAINSNINTGASNQPEPGERNIVTELRPLLPASITSKPNTDVYLLVKNGELHNVEYINSVSAFSTFDVYYQVKQDAMMPDYKPGDILALSVVPDGATIINGSPGVIDTFSMGFVFRNVYDRGDHIECRVTNKESNYENCDIKKTDIIRMYRVVGLVRTGM